ncbi:MAG: hypothetical protein AAFQ64_04890 [Pseudomonadota bacterium]
MRSLFCQSDLLALQGLDAILKRFHHLRAGGFYDPVEDRINLVLQLPDLRVQGLLFATGACEAHVPGIDEHDLGERKNLTRGL